MLQQNAVEPATLELLKQICALPQVANFAFGGGTNIALRPGHRVSLERLAILLCLHPPLVDAAFISYRIWDALNSLAVAIKKLYLVK